MKNIKDYEDFLQELKELCNKHEIFMLGTCHSEGIYGEITLGDSANSVNVGWKNIEERLDNIVRDEKRGFRGENRNFVVYGVGNVK